MDLLFPLMKCVQFAAYKHRKQTRKNNEKTPFINHPINVATILVAEGHIDNKIVLMAALLHDTVEDTDTTFEEIEQEFGKEICDVIREVTDDTSLERQERERLQIVNAKTTSYYGKLVQLADKLENLRELQQETPTGWTDERSKEYFVWAKQVVDNLRGTNEQLKNLIDNIFREEGLMGPN